MTRGLLLAMLLGFALSGCAFGTNYVSLPTSPATVLPREGEPLTVQVKDARADLSGSMVGFKRNGYGGKTGDVALRDNQALADRIAADVVALLRERGYKAYGPNDTPNDRADIAVTTEIAGFIVDTKVGFWTLELQGFSVLRVRAADASRRVLWEDVIRAEYKKDGLMAIIESDHQEAVEGLYAATMKKLREEVPARFSK